MAEVVHDVQQEFWRPPVALEGTREIVLSEAPPTMAEVCSRCSTEFMIGSRFCHACGAHRPENGVVAATSVAAASRELLAGKLRLLHTAATDLSKLKFNVPAWLRYLHFHEIKRWVGLPTPSLIAFIIGLGCVVGALGVSLFYRASNLAEFQAIQMWRIEWLLAATASFVAAILLKTPSNNDPD
jgi:hypothetical protein